jgi:flagellar biosynthesis/type III secretory pathway M-ring protein FliF/YscJ
MQNEVMTGAGLLAGLFFVAAGINQVLRLVDRTKEKPPPAETYMTKETCRREHEEIAQRFDRVETEVRAIREQIRQDRVELDQADEERASKLHDRINLIAEEMPGKVVSLLRNTGALGR